MFRFGSVLLLAMLSASAAGAEQAGQQDLEWRFYGHDAHGTKYSPADQINADNVQELRVAWRWQNPDDVLGKAVGQPVGHFKATPLMVNGVLYVSTGLSQAAAVDGETGDTLWVYDPEAYKLGRPANTGWQHRGLAYWQNDAGDDRRVVYATGTGRLVALNVDTGKPIQAFGEKGQVDLQASRTTTSCSTGPFTTIGCNPRVRSSRFPSTTTTGWRDTSSPAA